MSKIAERVNREVIERSKGSQPFPRIFLNKKDYIDFMKEVKPLYKKQYDGFIACEDAVKDGLENILYHGCAVCLSLDKSPN